MSETQSRPGVDLEYWLDGAAVLRKNLRREDLQSDVAALTTAVMLSVALYLEAGDTVTNLTFKSGTTAAGTPTNWWFALYSTAATPVLIAQTADQTSTAWAADTAKTVALATPYKVTATGIYRAAIMVKATTPPTLAGITLDDASGSAAIIASQKVLASTADGSLAATAPATMGTQTAVATVPLVIAN